MVALPIYDPIFPLEVIFAGQTNAAKSVKKVRDILKRYVQSNYARGDACNAACSGTCIYTPTFSPLVPPKTGHVYLLGGRVRVMVRRSPG